MEQWKLVLADNVLSYGNYYGGRGYAVSLSCANGFAVSEALSEGINSLSTDYRSHGVKFGDNSTVIVNVGSTQARDEFQSRLAGVLNEVARWRATGYANNEDKLKADLEAKQAEIEAKTAEINRQKDKDTWGIIMVMCVAAALVLLIYE